MMNTITLTQIKERVTSQVKTLRPLHSGHIQVTLVSGENMELEIEEVCYCFASGFMLKIDGQYKYMLSGLNEEWIAYFNYMYSIKNLAYSLVE